VEKVHIITVGASLALNYEREECGKRVSATEIEDRLRKSPETKRVQYSKNLEKYIRKKEEENKLSESSAELNALKGYLKEISLAYLIHTDTNLGRCCARAIKGYLTEKGIQVAEPIEIRGLHGPETFQKGLANLVKKIAEILRNHRGETRICATGGFKPEVALASVVGFIAQAPIYYIHESFREEVHLPAIPLNWRLDMKKYGGAIDILLTSGDEGIQKESFIEKFGRETYQTLLTNWLIEEREERLITTEVSKAILESMRLLSKT